MKSTVDIHSMNILIVDDSVNSTVLLKAVLQKENFNNLFVANGLNSALLALSENKIDLILLSFVLPDISGVEVCYKISSQMPYADIPIIMVTANCDIKTLQSSFENGAIDYIAKPFNGKELLARVQAHLIRKRVSDERQKIAITDPLTNIYNRRHFDTIFEHFYSRALLEDKTISFFMVDIDNFKKYNDNYGHQKGDDALKKVAMVLENELNRTDDYLFRIGGEEFAILLYDTPEVFLKALSMNIHRALKNLHVEHDFNEDFGYLTISMGVSNTTCENKISKFDIYNSADKLLYQAKDSGRNKTVFTSI